MKITLEGWSGGSYDDLGLFKTQREAEMGLVGERLFDHLYPFEGKFVRITVEEIDERANE